MISIIVPVFNVEKYLQSCVDSLLCQTCSDIEIILIDDGSTDGSGKLCDEYAVDHDNIRVLHKDNAGPSDCRNVGLSMAGGEYIAFVDSDDFIAPKMLEILLDNLVNTDSDISICRFLRISEGSPVPEDTAGNTLRVLEGDEIIHDLGMPGDNTTRIVPWNKLYKRRMFENVTYPKGRFHEDEATIHRILYNCRRLVYTDMTLYYYLQRNNGSIMSTQGEKRIPDQYCDDIYFAFSDRISFLQSVGRPEESGAAFRMLLGDLLTDVYFEHYNKPEGYRESIGRIFDYIVMAMNDFKVYNNFGGRNLSDCRMLLKHEKMFWMYRYVRINVEERIINKVRNRRK